MCGALVRGVWATKGGRRTVLALEPACMVIGPRELACHLRRRRAFRWRTARSLECWSPTSFLRGWLYEWEGIATRAPAAGAAAAGAATAGRETTGWGAARATLFLASSDFSSFSSGPKIFSRCSRWRSAALPPRSVAALPGRCCVPCPFARLQRTMSCTAVPPPAWPGEPNICARTAGYKKCCSVRAAQPRVQAAVQENEESCKGAGWGW